MANKFNSLIVGLTLASASQLTVAQDLSQIYQLALQNDPSVLKAEALYNATHEQIEQARSVLLPQISGSASYTDYESDLDFKTANDQDTDSESQTLAFSLALSMQLYNHSSWLNLDTSKKTAHQSDINYQYVKQQLITRVSNAYFNVLGAYDGLEFAQAEKKAIARQLEQTKQRFDVGLTAITAVHEAQAQYDNSVAQEISTQNSVYVAEEALREITGVYPRDLNVLNTDRFSPFMPTPSSADEWQKTAEAKNLQLIGQKIGMDIAKDQISIASAGHLPTLSLSAGLGMNDIDDKFGDDYDNDTQSIAITLSVPIYEGGYTSSTVRAAEHNYAAASQDMQLTYRSIVRDARNSYNAAVATISGVKAFEQSVLSAESALQATEAGFDVGTRTIVDVLDSTRNLYDAKRNLSTTRYQYITNMLQLKAAAGNITEADIAAINSGLIAK